MMRTYKCPNCGLIATRTSKEMEGNNLTKGQLPAFLICGKCYSEKPSKSVRMWGDDIPEEDRNEKKYNNYGLERMLKKREFERASDISFQDCKRYLVRILLRGSPSNEDLIEKAGRAVQEIIVKEKVNGIAVGFWRTKGEAMKTEAVAMVVWAPGGIWGEAYTVKAGDYSKHRYEVEFNRY